MAGQLNLLFNCLFVTLIFVSNGSIKVSNSLESSDGIIKSIKFQDHNIITHAEDAMLMDSTDCDCGPNSEDCWKNNTNEGRKCKCKNGYAPLLKGKDESCEKCDCGKFGLSCKFNEKDGRQNCTCAEGYGQKYLDVEKGIQTCDKCDCGRNGVKCMIFPQGKYCECQLGKYKDYFVEKIEKKCKECDCGPKSIACDFNNRKNTFCQCAEGYFSEKITKDSDDEVCTQCDCGKHGQCNVKIVENRSIKQCICEPGYVEVDGKCQRCDCGLNSLNCTYNNSFKRRMCDCKEGYVSKETYVFKDEYCERCDCGEFGVSCKFLFGYRMCTCQEGYSPNDLSGDRNDYCKKDSWFKGGMIVAVVVGVAFILGIAAVVIIRVFIMPSRRNR